MTRRLGRTSVWLVGAAVITVLAAACGGTKTAGAGSKASSSSSPTASGAVLGVGTTALGSVLVDGRGRTLYLLTADSPNHSSCSAQCLQYWPLAAAPASGAAPSVAGISAKIGTTKGTSGQAMLTAGGHPLYAYVADQKAGDVTGQGVKTFGGTWSAVSPAGQPIKAAPAGATASPSSGGKSGGYY